MGQIAYFSLRMRETPIILLPVKKSDVTIVFADPNFLYDARILTIRP